MAMWAVLTTHCSPVEWPRAACDNTGCTSLAAMVTPSSSSITTIMSSLLRCVWIVAVLLLSIRSLVVVLVGGSYTHCCARVAIIIYTGQTTHW